MLPSYKNKPQSLRALHVRGKYSTSVIHETSLFTFNFETDSHKVAQAALALSTAQAKRWTSCHPTSVSGLTGRGHQVHFRRDTS